MPNQIGLAFTSVVAFAGSGLSFYFWRKSASLYSLLIEGANRFEQLRHRTQSLEATLAEKDEWTKTVKDRTTRLERGVDDAREKASDLVTRLAAKEAESAAMSEKLELQKNFLEKQLAKAQDQLRSSEEAVTALRNERSEAATQLGREKEARQKLVRAAEQAGDLREKDATLKLREAERVIEAMKKKFAAIDPVEIKRVKRKIAQYDRLYASMRGMREMVEERNKNWEVALTKFARWIIAEASGPDARIPDQIGPLVGRALDLIGAQLIDDSAPDEAPRPGGAERAASFDSPDNGERARAHARLAAELVAAEEALANEGGEPPGEEARLAAATLRRGDTP